MAMMEWQLMGLAVLLAWVVGMYVRAKRRESVLKADLAGARQAARAALGADESGVARLPVLSREEIARIEGPPKCGNCAHFDLEEGQAIFRAHRAFDQASQFVSPALMSQNVVLDDAGNPMIDDDGGAKKTEPAVPHKTQWSEFGACFKHSEGRWQGDHCDEHEWPSVDRSAASGTK